MIDEFQEKRKKDMKELVEKAEKAASMFPVIDYVSVRVVFPFHLGNA